MVGVTKVPEFSRLAYGQHGKLFRSSMLSDEAHRAKRSAKVK